MAKKTLLAKANKQILESLQTWGLDAQMDSAGVICGIGPLRANCIDIQVFHHGMAASLIIDLVIDPTANLMLRENVMHIGESTDKAIGLAVFMWTMSVFVTAAALVEPEGCPGHMAGNSEREFVDGNGTARLWKIYSSPFLLSGSGADQQSEEAAEDKPETLVFFEPLLPQLCCTPRIHTIKAFLMNSDGYITGDCAIDGQSSEEALDFLKDFDWQHTEGMQYLRQFHLLTPADLEIDRSRAIAAPPAPVSRGLLGKLFSRG